MISFSDKDTSMILNRKARTAQLSGEKRLFEKRLFEKSAFTETSFWKMSFCEIVFLWKFF